MDQKDAAILKKLGQTIAKKRKMAGYTQEQVAEHLGIGNEAFSRIERGLNSPGIPKLYLLAELFECGVETFLIEGSRRPTDQAEHIEQMLNGLHPTDRAFLVEGIERLSLRFKNPPPDTPKKPSLPRS